MSVADPRGRNAPAPGREALAVGAYAALVALPFAAILPWLSTGGTALSTGVAAGLCWRWLAAGRERVSLLRAAGVGALAGAALHPLYSFGAGVFFYVQSRGEDSLVESLATGLKMGIVHTVFGSVVSVPVGIAALLGYVALIRPRLFRT